MPITRLTRPNQSWAIALNGAFANPAAPTAAELNDRRYVHFLSCAFTEDGTELTKGDSETDDTLTACSIGSEVTPTFANLTGNVTWLKDANTGGSGSTVDLTSLYNKAEAMLGDLDIPYWLISRTGPSGAQDANFAVGHVIKMANFLTDYPQYVLEQNTPLRGTQALVFQGSYNWNYRIAS